MRCTSKVGDIVVFMVKANYCSQIETLMLVWGYDRVFRLIVNSPIMFYEGDLVKAVCLVEEVDATLSTWKVLEDEIVS